MRFRLMIAATGSLLLAACGPSGETPAPAAPAESAADAAPAAISNADRAREIAMNSIIIDTHIDVPYRIVDEWEDVTGPTEGGDYDYPRAVAGGLNAPFMSIYTPAGLEAEGSSKQRAEDLIEVVERIVATAPDKYAIALSPADVEAQFEQGLISLPMGMENGSPIEGDLANLRYFHERGIRYITLAHSLSNHLSDSSYDDNKAHGGLSEFGKTAVREMNRLGIMIDISHVSDDAFRDVLEITSVPVIASHSSARHFTPGWERNMSDDMIKALAENGGVIQINFGSSFISQAARDYGRMRSEAFDTFRESLEGEPSEEQLAEFRAQFEAENGPYPYATLDQVLDHFDRVVELTGSVDHVGIGSDYDGVGDSLPIGLKDVSTYPNLIEGLLDRGYSEQDVRKILGGNLLRVWREVEAAAERSA
jgi:membrane dipeptidase